MTDEHSPPLPERRTVLRAAGASLALAAAAGCDVGPAEFGHPLHARARGVTEEALTYATVLDLDGLGRGVLVRTRAGHAIKIEGNPAHPASLGATDVFLEAAVLSLHDPARSRRSRRAGRALRETAGLPAFLEERRAALAAAGGAGLRLLTGPVSSPTQRRLIGAVLAAFPEARWHVHAPLADAGAAEGARRAFGEAVVPVHDLSRAACTLSLGADLLGPGPAQLRQARDWSAARAPGRAGQAPLPRLIVAESVPSLTGAKADQRLALPPAGIEALARAVAAELGIAAAGGAPHPEAPGIAAALRAAGPSGLVAAGRGQPASVHALAQAMNATLGAMGTTVRLIDDPAGAAEAGDLAALAGEMAQGAVTDLLVLDANPVLDAPAGLDMPALLARVPHTLHAGLYPDETALACAWHLPLRHPLECWGDSLAFEGTAALRQPATVPLVETALPAEEILAHLAGRPAPAEALVRETWREAWGEEGFEERWLAALEGGVVPDSAAPARELRLRPDFDPGPAAPETAGFTALFLPDPHLWDGRFAPNAWLQELPRPLEKLAWGNAALIAPQDAMALLVGDGAEAEITLHGRSLTVPVVIAPGQAPGVVALPLGGGRRAAGGVEPGLGFDAYRLRPAAAPWAAPGLALRPTGRVRPLVSTAWHHPVESDPPPARRVAQGEVIPPLPPPRSLYPDWSYPGHAWGMAIDLDACIGCNACSLACQAENNTPVVGPEETARGRAMHWLRVDRYHRGPPEAPETDFQPVPCMHCEKAPCEVVCPVNATVHDHEGLNLMVYPRCIGTRTCSNNCPYKVRRFNWADYARATGAVPVRNPEVPLRARGVIEKCTYCQHRIVAARTAAGLEGRPIREGEVETACQRACPTRAISFGDVNDPASTVSRARREGRHYALLGHLDTRPRTTYLARVVPAGTRADAMPAGTRADAMPAGTRADGVPASTQAESGAPEEPA
ncbi:4Fe-4S dicluster domain-containing protein [Roseicella aerolata]|uniref:4Fe-4S dicluster domain-containing protein n=1 Tax=Roseicella aerolata TaxID=2883479 RepID=A0A9X1LBV3_9PROT|nr:4Fe-4S dicluster domain-containing protein [Roseicella aerolata]MCB4823478.1 4Fe-4S dicluster domain-containing protein [Roseicella aerolata]